MTTPKMPDDRGQSSANHINYGPLESFSEWVEQSVAFRGAKIAVISNPTVFRLYGDAVTGALLDAGRDVVVWKMKDGEEYKDLKSVESALRFLSTSGITRTDAVIGLGGGVVGDLAGFTASVYLRGVDFLLVPTTLLSMIDSSIGGKTGVNSPAGKNVIGTFKTPTSVLIDAAVLGTLPPREITAGYCEMIKHGALAGRRQFRLIADLIAANPPMSFETQVRDPKFLAKFTDLIRLNIEFKLSIVTGDERESAARTDARSRKILNLGHTLAHALEKVTDYRYFKHGEAVGYGLIYAAELSKMLDLCPQNDVNLLNDVVHRAGSLPPLNDIDPQEVFEAFIFDKKHVAGSLQMVLLKGIGRPVIVKGENVPASVHKKALEKLLRR